MFRNYVPHEDPGLNASTRMLLKLRLIRVQGLLDKDDEHNLPYLRSVAKDPARVATVKRVLEYGWVQCGTSLEETFRSYGIAYDEEDEEKSRTIATEGTPAPAPRAPAPAAAPGPAVSGTPSSPQAPCRSRPARPVDYNHFAFE